MNLSNISLRQLRIFLAVAEHQGFSRAGNMVGLTQSAMSHSIRDLENELGIKLFDRTTREVFLTQEGQYLSGELRRLMGELEATFSNAWSRGEQHSGLVHVATSPTISAGIMPHCIKKLINKYPQINVMIHDQVQKQTIQKVVNGEVDFGVIVEPSTPSDLHTETFMEEPFCLILPPTHKLARQKKVEWGRLKNQDLVLLDDSSGSRSLIDNALIRNGVTPHVVQELGHVATIFRILESGIGVSIIPQIASSAVEKLGLVCRPLYPTENRKLQLARRHNRSLSPAASVVWNMIQNDLTLSLPVR